MDDKTESRPVGQVIQIVRCQMIWATEEVFVTEAPGSDGFDYAAAC